MTELVKIELLTALTILSEEGGYDRAAQRLGTTPNRLERHVAALERQTGLRLIFWQDSRISLTEDGKGLVTAYREFFRGTSGSDR